MRPSPCWTSGSGQQGWLLCSFHIPAAWYPVWIHPQGEPYLLFLKKPARRSCVGPAPRLGVSGRLFSAPSVASSVYWLSAGNGFARNSLCTWGTRSTRAVISLESVSGSSQTRKSKTGCSEDKIQVRVGSLGEHRDVRSRQLISCQQPLFPPILILPPGRGDDNRTQLRRPL